MKKINLGNISKELVPNMAENNPRNSEGAFFSLANGEVIFVYSKFKGKDNSDHATSDICLIRSTDDGVTFGEDETITTCEGEQAVNIMSLSLLQMQNGDLGLFYLVRTTYTLLQMFLRRSSDGGRTWSERVLCTPIEGFFVVNNDRVTRLDSGRILIPAAWHHASPSYFDNRSDVIFFYSDDDGVTWKPSDTKCSMPYTQYCQSGLQEPGVMELAPGYIWAWARTDLGRQYEMFSRDNGNTWTACQPSRFTSPNSPLSMKRDKKGTLYAIWNPVPEYNGREKAPYFTGGRNPFVIAKSEDNGNSFTEPAAFEDDERHGFCYCAIHFTEEAMLLAYCAGGEEERSCLTRTRIRRVELSQLEMLTDLQ